MKARSKPRMLLLVAVVLATLGGLSTFAIRKVRAERALPERLVSAANRHGVVLELGKTSIGLFGVQIADSQISLRDDAGVRAKVAKILMDCPLFSPTSTTFLGVKVIAKTEPSKLFEHARSLLGGQSELPLRWEEFDLDYEHSVVGRLSLKDLVVEQSGPALAAHARHAELGGVGFEDVQFSLARRGDFLQVRFGAKGDEKPKIELLQYSSPQGRSDWMFNIAHQPLSDLLTRLGWAVGPELDETAVVGMLSLKLRPNEPRMYGQLQLTFDRWPKPDWPEATAMLGRSAALFARIEAGEEPWHFQLPYVEATLPLFRLRGPGRLVPFGPKGEARFDITGKELCGVLATRAEPSSYHDALAAFVSTQAPSTGATLGTEAKEQPAAELRIQLDATSAPSPRATLAMALGEACGIEGKTASTFQSLALPAFVPLTPATPPSPAASSQRPE